MKKGTKESESGGREGQRKREAKKRNVLNKKVLKEKVLKERRMTASLARRGPPLASIESLLR